MPTSLPNAPLPPPLTSDEPGSWAFDTMSRRVRTDILTRVFRENSFLPAIVDRLTELDDELSRAAQVPLSLIPSDGGPDVSTWNFEILPPFIQEGATWLSAPWAVAEFYLYRRIMSAIDYFNNPVDPFLLQKELGLTSAIDSIDTLSIRVNSIFDTSASSDEDQRINHLQTLVLTALWGNRMDLSLWPVGGDGAAKASATNQSAGERATEAFSSVMEAGQKMILANNMPELSEYVRHMPSKPRMDIIVDNAGFELFCDLCLADFLIFSGLASRVHLQLKAHPTFVSDAMAKDVSHTIKFLQESRTPDGAPTPQSVLGDRWASHVTSGSWQLTEHFFWVQPQAMWEMPKDLREELSISALVFVKGDANYRRLLGDRHWPFATPFHDVIAYFPTALCALRTLKAELGCGMSTEVTDRIAGEDPKWLVAGKYGVIHFCDTKML